jgi:hypothetical protein
MAASDDIEVVATEQTFELVPPGAYPAVVKSIDRFDGTDFRTGEPRAAVRITFEIADGEWAGETVDRVVNLPENLANERAKLHEFFKGITGITPEPGRTYRLREWLVGRRCTVLVEHYTNQKGQTWARVASVAPQPARRGRAGAAPPAPAVPVAPPPRDADDDLDDA